MGVGHLPRAPYVPKIGVDAGRPVRPEFAAAHGMDRGEDLRRDGGALADPDEEADQRTLHHGTEREPIDAGRPRRRPLVVLVLGDRERDEHVRVEQVGRHSSSSAVATCSDVTRRPTLMTGNPDRESVPTTMGSSS